MHFLKERRVRGLDVSIYVTDDGYFVIQDAEGNEIAKGKPLSNVEHQADKRLRQHKRKVVAVPYTTEDFRPAIAKGKHARTGAILVWIDDGTEKGTNDQLYAYSSRANRVLKPDLPKNALIRRKKIEEARQKVELALDAWDKKYRFSLTDAVNHALLHADENTTQPGRS